MDEKSPPSEKKLLRADQKGKGQGVEGVDEVRDQGSSGCRPPDRSHAAVDFQSRPGHGAVAGIGEIQNGTGDFGRVDHGSGRLPVPVFTAFAFGLVGLPDQFLHERRVDGSRADAVDPDVLGH